MYVEDSSNSLKQRVITHTSLTQTASTFLVGVHIPCHLGWPLLPLKNRAPRIKSIYYFVLVPAQASGPPARGISNKWCILGWHAGSGSLWFISVRLQPCLKSTQVLSRPSGLHNRRAANCGSFWHGCNLASSPPRFCQVYLGFITKVPIHGSPSFIHFANTFVGVYL